MRDAGRYAAQVGKLLGEVPVGFQFLKRIVVTEAHQRPDGLASVLDVLYRGQQPMGIAAAGYIQGAARDGSPLAQRSFDNPNQRVVDPQAFVYWKPGQLCFLGAEK